MRDDAHSASLQALRGSYNGAECFERRASGDRAADNSSAMNCFDVSAGTTVLTRSPYSVRTAEWTWARFQHWSVNAIRHHVVEPNGLRRREQCNRPQHRIGSNRFPELDNRIGR